jgi:hypothetical protein
VTRGPPVRPGAARSRRAACRARHRSARRRPRPAASRPGAGSRGRRGAGSGTRRERRRRRPPRAGRAPQRPAQAGEEAHPAVAEQVLASGAQDPARGFVGVEAAPGGVGAEDTDRGRLAAGRRERIGVERAAGRLRRRVMMGCLAGSCGNHSIVACFQGPIGDDRRLDCKTQPRSMDDPTRDQPTIPFRSRWDMLSRAAGRSRRGAAAFVATVRRWKSSGPLVVAWRGATPAP